MRGSHGVNLRRVLSLPTSRHDTTLLGRYHPSNRQKRSGNTPTRDDAPCNGKPATTPAASAHRRTPTAPTDGRRRNNAALLTSNPPETRGHPGNYPAPCQQPPQLQPPTGVPVSTAPTATQHPTHRTLNAAFDRGDIASSALSLLDKGTSQSSVEALLARDIGRNLFNLPVQRLRVWLYNADVGSVAQATLRHLYSASYLPEKALVADAVILNKLESGPGLTSCRDAFLLLKLQRVLLSKSLKSTLNLPVYQRCIQLLNAKAGRLPGDYLVHLSLTLDSLWRHLSRGGALDSIRDCHAVTDAPLSLSDLHSPLVLFLEKAAFDISCNTVPPLLDLLVRLQHHLAKEALLPLHKVAFLKVIEFAHLLPLDAALRSLRLLERLESSLPLPFYFLCQRVLAKPGDTVEYAVFHTAARCLSRCHHVANNSLHRLLLLYRSFLQHVPAYVYNSSERFVAASLLRALEVAPATAEAKLELSALYSPSENPGAAALAPASTGSVRLPEGYYRRIRSLQDLTPLLASSLVHLRRSGDASVPKLCDLPHLKRHYGLRGGLRLPIKSLLRDAGHPQTLPTNTANV
ncbi:SACPA operon antiterminator, putative [Babesia caballi]|uniref:SACPA operon antiterminator, putative n=1 Tax=Babesia caballi TaxID=5871 RepID=A0AAV4LQ08_BABCB|nr:SACPA operon antiterminator, putative [Babesia caballi]